MASGHSLKSKKRIFRNLSTGLILSVVLNACLIGYICYIKIESLSQPFQISLKQKKNSASVKLKNNDLYIAFKDQPIEKLLTFLNDKRWAEDGLKVRDIALAILYAENFDIERALGKIPHGHKWIFSDTSLIIFQKLTDQDFKQLEEFGKNERWPISSKKMFTLLKENTVPDPTLEEAFMLTAPFQNLAQSLPGTENRKLLQMTLEGNWETLQSVQTDDRQNILLTYIDTDSPTAAYLLLKYEPFFAFKQLDNEYALKTLQLLTEKNALTAKFALSMLASPRSEEVKELAMKRLTSFTNKSDFVTALVPQKKEPLLLSKPISITKPTPTPSKARYHIVQSGDSLWKISKQWNVPLSELKKQNGLTDDSILQPGLILKIP